MHDLNEALFLKDSFLFFLFPSYVALRFILPLTAIYKSVYSHISGLSTEVLNFIFLAEEYWPLDKSFILVHFLLQILTQLSRSTI